MKTLTKDRKKLQWNIVITIICQIVSLIINLISKRAIKIYLGINYLGLQSVYSNFCDVLSFAFLGMGTTMLFSCYGAFAQKDNDKVASVFQCYNNLYKKISKIALTFGVLSIIAVIFVTNTNIEVKEIVITYTCFMISVILYNRFLFQNFFVESDEKRYVVVIITNGIDAMALFVQVICLKYIGNYISFVICILLKDILIYLVFKIYLMKKYPYLRNKVPAVSKEEMDNIQKNVNNMMVYRFGSVLISNTDSIFISKLINTVTVGIYSNYQFIISGVNSLVAAFYGAIAATIGRLVQTTKKEKQFENFILCSLINIWITGFTTVCFFYLVEDFIKIWMGKVDLLQINVLIIILINYYVVACRYATRVYRESTGMFDKIQNVVLIKGILNIILSYILGMLWGLQGILIATTIASVVTLFWYEAKLVYAYFNKPFIYEIIYQICSIGLLIFSLWFTGVCTSFIVVKGVLFFALKFFICLLSSNFIYILFALLILYINRNYFANKIGEDYENNI